MNYPDIDDVPLPFELYTEEELEEMAERAGPGRLGTLHSIHSSRP